MKHLSNFIQIIPLTDFTSFDGTAITGITDPDSIQTENEPEFSDNPKETSAGVIHDQNLEVVTAKLSDKLKRKYANNRPVVALLYDDNGNIYQWGDDHYRLRIIIRPHLDKDVIKLSRKAASPLF